MNLQRKISYTVLILLFFSGSLFSQNSISEFKDKIDLYLLDNFVWMTDNDTVFVSNLYDYSGDSSREFYFYNSKTRQKIFPYGFE
ncbi:hypothetical protein, partial [Chryseobacterium sp. HMWF001]